MHERGSCEWKIHTSLDARGDCRQRAEWHLLCVLFRFCLFARRDAMLRLTEKYFQSAAFVLSARTYICIVCVCERRTLVLLRYKYTCTLSHPATLALSLKNVITLLFCSAAMARALSRYFILLRVSFMNKAADVLQTMWISLQHSLENYISHSFPGQHKIF